MTVRVLPPVGAVAWRIGHSHADRCQPRVAKGVSECAFGVRRRGCGADSEGGTAGLPNGAGMMDGSGHSPAGRSFGSKVISEWDPTRQRGLAPLTHLLIARALFAMYC